MKYLIFNAAVFLALGYLIAGGKPADMQQHVERSVQKVKAQAERIVEKPAPPKVTKPIAQKIVESVKKPQPVKKEVQKPASPPPLPKAVDVAKVEPKKAPSRAQATVQKTKVAPVIEQAEKTATKPVTALSDAKERSKALRQMVADMEQMFAEKMTR
ncbi:hypothetical protein [Terasakiella sp. SH-1]|uniref:hypothetical protein n=1 Tax=Terasakiella sp. SH-1 TaxID=2560057 RepID=UPI00107397B4|nr:hypothetical protein [Terasakiella sp. SH-1]